MSETFRISPCCLHY